MFSGAVLYNIYPPAISAASESPIRNLDLEMPDRSVTSAQQSAAASSSSHSDSDLEALTSTESWSFLLYNNILLHRYILEVEISTEIDSQ